MNKKKFVIVFCIGLLVAQKTDTMSPDKLLTELTNLCLHPLGNSVMTGAGNFIMHQYPTSFVGSILTTTGLIFSMGQHSFAGIISQDPDRKKTNMKPPSLLLFLATGVSAGYILYDKKGDLSFGQKICLGFQGAISFYSLIQNILNYERDKKNNEQYGKK